MQQFRQGFVSPDPRYGPVPLWWWSGERVTAGRLRWQMQKLHTAGLRNLCIINLAPAGPTYACPADDPPFYSEQWWDLFGQALDEAERLGMFLWYYDQIGFSGANFPARLVAERPEFSGYQLRRFPAGAPLPHGAESLLDAGGQRYATVRQGFDWLNPEAAGALLDRIHGEMERRHGDRLGRVIAGSFQDELQPMTGWTATVPEAYRQRYGEDLLPLLPVLFDGGPAAGQVRRRFYGLLAEMAETAFFRPLGDWHDRHGMLLGCDQAGSGRQVDPHGAQRLYLDYFRTHRHLSAPGMDMDGEAKPHSSLVHTHGGKRVWLEGFHSSGWGGTVEETLHWLVPWLQAGVTLFDPHAIYYSTGGGWWEWAPPDTGWRQPYSEHYPIFANTVARACWALAQGHHLCDLSVYYPGHAVWEHMSPGDQQPGEHPQGVANRDPNPEVRHIRQVYWALVGRQARHQAALGILRADRRDFDLLDDLALARTEVRADTLTIAEERYRAIILPGASPPEPEVRERLSAFAAGGGLVLAVALPEGAWVPDGAVRLAQAEDVPAALAGALPRPADGPSLGLARRVGDADVFLLLPPTGSLMAMHAATTAPPQVPATSVYRLRTAGIPELWDPVRGTQRPLPFRHDGEYAVLEVPFSDWPAALVVCRPAGAAATEQTPGDMPAQEGPLPAPSEGPEMADGLQAVALGPWQVRVESTLDNRYGDFDALERSDFVPIERRTFRVATELGPQDGEAAGWQRPTFDDGAWPERLWSEAARWLVCRGERFDSAQAQPVVYSTQLGDMSFRDWAGRMGRVPRTFLNLGSAEPGETLWAQTHVLVPATGRYWLQLEGAAVKSALVDGREMVSAEPEGAHAARTQLDLAEGSHEILLRCTAVRRGLVRLGVQVTAHEPPAQPEWVAVAQPAADGQWALEHRVETPVPPSRVRLHFAAHGHIELWVNGARVAVEGDFNPYARYGQQALDVTGHWRVGQNVLRLVFPEQSGAERALVDGVAELRDGTVRGLITSQAWTDATGRSATRPAHTGTTESLWIRPRAHPLPDVGWLMPESVGTPLPLLLDPERARQPVWLRFPLPAGAHSLSLAARGQVRVWVDGQEVQVRQGQARFAPQPPGNLCAIRVIPAGAQPEAAVLDAPVRFETSVVPGPLGDWRTALCLPHHSGVVEYETSVEGRGTSAWLDLGYVRGTAQVWLDGQDMGTRLWHPFRYNLERAWGTGRHRLRVRVTNTLGTHYEVGRPTSLVGTGQAAGGLFGPVSLVESSPKA